jgi:hypothetical protein
MSASSTKLPLRPEPLRRIASRACVAERRGRKPYEQSLKSTSKIGSKTSFVAVARRDHVPSEFPADAVLHSLSESSAAAPPAVGTFLRGASSRVRSRTTLRLTLGCCRSSRHRRPLHPCSASLDPTPSRGRHASRCDQTARGIAVPRLAWPLPLDDVVVARRCRPMNIGRGSWVVGTDDDDASDLRLRRYRLAFSLVGSRASDSRLCRRISRVPCSSLDACCAQYPAGIVDDRFG